MELKEKVYATLVANKFFDTTDTITIVSALCKKLGISNSKASFALADLIHEKRLSASKSGREIKNNGKVSVGVYHASKGAYGFITVKGQERDIYVADGSGAREGDIVELAFFNGSNGKEKAFISKIVKRQKNKIIGVVRKTDEGVFVFVPDEKNTPEYVLPQGKEMKDKEGKKCSLRITTEATSKTPGEGVIDKVYGYAEDPIAENRAIADSFGFSKTFPESVMAEVAAIPQQVLPEELEGRLDLRHLKFTTWDPKSCKDKDDAMYVEKTENGYRVYVAIADVAHYVKRGSAIDREAYARGTSCYLGDGVYPMLPPELSNGICSLNEGEDRLVLASIIDIDNEGRIQNFSCHEAVINVVHSLSYEEAEDIHLSRNGKEVEFADVKETVDTLYEAYAVLAKKLETRGSISFKSKEPTFSFDWSRREVLDVTDTSRDLSHAVVEQMMILNNEILPIELESRGLRCLYRVHDKPQDDKLMTTNGVLEHFGISHTLRDDPVSYQALTHLISGSKYEDILTGYALRSMCKARYQPENIGHFGLASQGYAHTTSPIRRYPDLAVHRILKENIHGHDNIYSTGALETMGEHLSEQERLAEAAEVQSNQVLCAYWGTRHIGEIFDGYISQLSQDSVTVRVGMVDFCVPLAELEHGKLAEYRLSKDRMTLTDRHSGKTYALADDMSVKLTHASVGNRKIYATSDLEKVLELPLDQTPSQDRREEKTPAQTSTTRQTSVVQPTTAQGFNK